MAELTIPPLLAHNPEPSPPSRWRILLLPAMMAILGILIATAAATSGQDDARGREQARLEKVRLEKVRLEKVRLERVRAQKAEAARAEKVRLEKVKLQKTKLDKAERAKIER